MDSGKVQLESNLAQRVSWDGDFQQRVRRFGRMISLAKRTSIFCGKNFPNAFPLLFVLGHYKSGTSWMCQLIADYLRIPFPQHSILPIGCPAVVHSLEAPSKKYRNGIYMMRDGRDSAVSAYFHVRGRLLAGSQVKHHKQLFAGLDLQAVPRENMAVFLKRLIENPGGGWTRLLNWGDHVGRYLDLTGDELKLVRYEDLLNDGPGTLSQLVEALTGGPADSGRVLETIHRYSFKKQTGRSAGDENQNSYLRKGQSGDWKNHFSKEAAEIFYEHFGEVLNRSGYESDTTWLEQVN